MEQIRGFVFRLAPRPEQEALLRQAVGVCRLVYNLALEQRRTWGRSHGIGYHGQVLELTALRAEFPWIAAVSQTAQTQALRDLDQAFQNFFAGRAGFPQPRRKGVDDTVRVMGREIATRRLNARWSEVRLPKIGWVRYRDTRPLEGEVRNATVRWTSLGWQISIACRTEIAPPTRQPGSVGIDRGVTVPLMLSTGNPILLPERMVALDRVQRRAQRIASRRKRGSKRHARALRRSNTLRSRIARIRHHWQHVHSTAIAQTWGVVSVEALRTKSMTRSARGSRGAPGRNVRQKAGLNRSILNVGWFGFEQKLTYKLHAQGGDLRRVDPAHTSQDCSACDHRDSRSRKSQADFACTHCGHAINADWNAAINIERRGNAPVLDVEGKAKQRIRARLPMKRQPTEGGHP